VARAIMLLAVARGEDYQDAARAAGRRSGDAVSHLVARFNAEGTAALTPRHGGGRSPVYGLAARERVLAEVNRTPTPEADGTATWSLGTLNTTFKVFLSVVSQVGGRSRCGGSDARSSVSVAASSGLVSSWGTS
jgi:hypothetical protein